MILNYDSIRFEEIPVKTAGLDQEQKKKIKPQWECYSANNGAALGRVIWYGPWMLFCFFSYSSIFNTQSIKDVQSFLNQVNK